MSATPTAPAQWFTPGYALEETDYMYYAGLLPEAEDTNPPVLVTAASGMLMIPCETCDLAAGTYLYATHTTRNIEVNLYMILFRLPTIPALQAKLQAEFTGLLDSGRVQKEIPTGF